MNRQVLEGLILDAVRDERYSRGCIQTVIEAAEKRVRELTAGTGNGDRAKELRKELCQVEPQIGNVMTAIKRGVVAKSVAAELKALEAKQERLRDALAQAKAPATKGLDALLAYLPHKVRALVDDMRPLLENGGAAEAKAHLGMVLDEVELRPARTKEGLPYLIAHLKGSLKRIIPLLAKRDANLVVAGVRFVSEKKTRPPAWTREVAFKLGLERDLRPGERPKPRHRTVLSGRKKAKVAGSNRGRLSRVAR